MTASAMYNCIPGKEINVKTGEPTTEMTYALYDRASDCTGDQPPGFPTKFLANECVEGSPGAGVYYFVDCSGSVVNEPSVVVLVLVLVLGAMLKFVVV